MLPATCPNARILLWGYDTILTRGYSPVYQSNLFAYSKDLLYGLARNRPKGRSIVFIAHSLGGLVVKEVLRRSQEDEDAGIQDIVESTKAIVFLGTPHRGSPGFNKLGNRALRFINTFMRMAGNQALLRSLGTDSPELELSRESFVRQWRTYNFQVKTFQESEVFSRFKFGTLGQKVSPRWCPGKLKADRGWSPAYTCSQVVPDSSSSLDDARQRAEKLDASHRDMTKFWGPSDPNYAKLEKELNLIMELLSPTTETNPSALVTTAPVPAVTPTPDENSAPTADPKPVTTPLPADGLAPATAQEEQGKEFQEPQPPPLLNLFG